MVSMILLGIYTSRGAVVDLLSLFYLLHTDSAIFLIFFTVLFGGVVGVVGNAEAVSIALSILSSWDSIHRPFSITGVGWHIGWSVVFI